jgi:allophanate hydrolase
MNPVVRAIIARGERYSAVDAFEGQYRLQALLRVAGDQWAAIDVLLLPTAGTIYTHDQVAANPVELNRNLGYYTNFVNLMDLAAVAVPAGFRSNGLPFGISLIGRAFSDEALLGLADLYLGAKIPLLAEAPGTVALGVVGAHLSGQPLNWQLTQRGARLTKTCRTAPGYRLFAQQGTTPPKPGLVRDDAFTGPGIEVEVWAMPENQFGGFVATVPQPLAIGKVTLSSGVQVNCFVCEPCAVVNAIDITNFGGWRSYLASFNK